MESEYDRKDDDFFNSIPIIGKGFFDNYPSDLTPPYKIYYCYTKEYPEDTVAINSITPDLELVETGEKSLSIYIRKDLVPEEYRRYVFIHELYEGNNHTHKEAREKELEYAQKYLSDEEYNKYLHWRDSLK